MSARRLGAGPSSWQRVSATPEPVPSSPVTFTWTLPVNQPLGGVGGTAIVVTGAALPILIVVVLTGVSMLPATSLLAGETVWVPSGVAPRPATGRTGMPAEPAGTVRSSWQRVSAGREPVPSSPVTFTWRLVVSQPFEPLGAGGTGEIVVTGAVLSILKVAVLTGV